MNTYKIENFGHLYRQKSNLEIRSSNIHKMGLFAINKFYIGDTITKENPEYIRVGKKLTEEQKTYGFFIDDYLFIPKFYIRYINHSEKPNARIQFYKRDVVLYAIDSISEGDEITIQYPNGII